MAEQLDRTMNIFDQVLIKHQGDDAYIDSFERDLLGTPVLNEYGKLTRRKHAATEDDIPEDLEDDQRDLDQDFCDEFFGE